MIGRDIIFNLIIQHGASWQKVFETIKNKGECPRWTSKEHKDYQFFISLIDQNFPLSLKNSNQPPFGIFAKGDLQLLSNKYNRVFISCDNPTTQKYDELIHDIGEKYVLVFTYSKNLIKRMQALPEGPIVVWSHLPLMEMSPNVVQMILERDGLIVTEYPEETQLHDRVNIRKRTTGIRAVASSDYTLVIEAQDSTAMESVVQSTVDAGHVLGCVPQDITAQNLNNSLLSAGAVCVSSVEMIEAELK